MKLLNESDELAIFSTDTITQLLDFKWAEYGLTFHKVGCFMQIIYIITICIYIYFIYITSSAAAAPTSPKLTFCPLLAAGTFYPTLYQLVKMYRHGPWRYLRELRNWLDIFFIYLSITNIIL